jgi:hypothetical protein
MATGTQQDIENATRNQALVRTEQQVSLSYGQRTEIREMVSRIRAGLPGSEDIPDSGIVALAQAAFAHDLDPWNGEVWCIYNKNKNETSIMAGVKGWRKVAKRQLPPSEHYYIEFQPIQPGSAEWVRYGLDTPNQYGKAVERAELCILRRSDQMSKYIEQLDKLKAVTGTYQEAREIAGNPPRYIGLGIVRVGDQSKMEKGQLVQKRAEQDALKKAFDLPFADRTPQAQGAVTIGKIDDDEYIEGEYTPAPTPPQRPANVTEDGEIIDEPKPAPAPVVKLVRPLNAEQVKATLGKKINASTLMGDCTPSQAGWIASLMGTAFKESPTKDKDRYAVMTWLFGRDITTTRDLTNAEASAVIDWLADETKDLSQDGATEIQRVYTEAMKAQGQTDMFTPDADKDAA